MIKKLFGVIAIIALLASCANKEQKKEENTNNEIAKVTVDQVMSDIQNYVDKDLLIEGTVTHVCAHGGKRMFIMGTNPDVAIKVTPNEEIGVFDRELEGSHVAVTGVLKELKIDETYVANLEKELAEGSDNEAVHDHSGDKKEETHEADEQKQQQIEAMRQKIAESENGYYSQYWIEASKFEVLESAAKEMETEDSVKTEVE